MATVETGADTADLWSLAIESAAGKELATTQGAKGGTATLTVTLDGTEPLRLVFAARSEDRHAAFRLSSLTCRRLLPDQP